MLDNFFSKHHNLIHPDPVKRITMRKKNRSSRSFLYFLLNIFFSLSLPLAVSLSLSLCHCMYCFLLSFSSDLYLFDNPTITCLWLTCVYNYLLEDTIARMTKSVLLISAFDMILCKSTKVLTHFVFSTVLCKWYYSHTFVFL